MNPKIKVKENSWIARLAARRLKSDRMAVTIGKTIHLYNTSRDYFLSDKKWARHEMQHVRQFRKYGLLRFLLMYLFESLRHGYYDNKWEVEARAAETEDPD